MDLRDRSGFTLIEVVIVLLIITIMAGIAAPALITPNSAATGLEEAANRFDTIFRIARESAVRTARPVTVVVDSVTGRVWVETQEHEVAYADSPTSGPVPGGPAGSFSGGSTLGTPTGAPGAGPEVPEGAQRLVLPDGISIEHLVYRCRFTFTPNGSAVGDSLRLRSRTGESALITIDPWSGHVLVR